MIDAHLDDERVQRVATDELAPAMAAATRDHLAACAACRNRVEAARHDDEAVNRLLLALDHPIPPVDAAQVIARAKGARPRASSPWLRRAAIVALSAGVAGAAWALPGSPVPDWFAKLAALVSGDAVRVASPPASPAPTGTQTGTTAGGVRIEPGDSLVIVFSTARPGASLRVTLVDESEAEVEAFASGTAFSPDPDAGVLHVDNSASGASFDIRIPRAARRVEIRIADHVVFLKAGDRITSAVTEDRGQWLVPMSETAGRGPA
ncbi:MAG: hypothetical protein L0271_16390 [Gemmatimonadetes bacterium]|nr:hypothetical protein [Gemmatimonadota bacterium]